MTTEAAPAPPTVPDNDFDAAKAVFEKLTGIPLERQERILRWVCESLGISLPTKYIERSQDTPRRKISPSRLFRRLTKQPTSRPSSPASGHEAMFNTRQLQPTTIASPRRKIREERRLLRRRCRTRLGWQGGRSSTIPGTPSTIPSPEVTWIAGNGGNSKSTPLARTW